MAAMTINTPTNAGATTAFAATAVGGDTVAWKGGRLVVEFRNGSGGSITISVAPVTTTLSTNAGAVPTPTRSLALAASADGVFEFSDADAAPYVDSSGNINFSYATGSTSLLYRALKVA